jgi:hypothetical protein
MDLNIRRISSTVHTGETAQAAEPTGMSETELDRLAAAVLERQHRLLAAGNARSLKPDDPAGDLGGWD